MACSTAALKVTVRRRPAVLVAPAAPTPRELKRLSDFDDQEALRLQIDGIYFYRRSESMDGQDPAPVIRDAVARALVHYYPLAGRVREVEGGKLAVDCTADGVLFIEADADVRLVDFGEPLLPPFPCLEELVFDVPGSSAILGAPLLLFQVTRLACGGFILSVRLNHTVADAHGFAQFLGAVAELARGAQAPTVRPVWARELLEAERPPQPRFPHRELFDEVPDTKGTFARLCADVVRRSFFFGPREVAAVRSRLGPELRERASRFDIVAGCLWRCRTAALAPDSGEETRMVFSINARGGRTGGAIPSGYYGNAFVPAAAISTAGELCANPLGYAVALVRRTKDVVDTEYVRSMANLLALRRLQPRARELARTYAVSDTIDQGRVR